MNLQLSCDNTTFQSTNVFPKSVSILFLYFSWCLQLLPMSRLMLTQGLPTLLAIYPWPTHMPHQCILLPMLLWCTQLLRPGARTARVNLSPVLKDLTLDTCLLLLLLLPLKRLLLLRLKGRREMPTLMPMLILRLTHGCTTAVCMDTMVMATDITTLLLLTPTHPTLTPMCTATMA